MRILRDALRQAQKEATPIRYDRGDAPVIDGTALDPDFVASVNGRAN
jgi:hypothetical protein